MSIKYIFILGMDHSGSTLLSFLLNTHDDIVTVGETCRVGRNIPDRWERKAGMCSCGKIYYECEFWNRVLAGLAARGVGIGKPDFFRYELFYGQFNRIYRKLSSFSSGRALLKFFLLIYKNKKLRTDIKFRAFVDAVLEVSGKSVFLDASKYYGWLYPLQQNGYLDLKILNLYRDGRGVTNSWRKKHPSLSFDTIVRRWVNQEKGREKGSGIIPDQQVLQVNYEQICIAPNKSLERIFDFIDVEPSLEATDSFKSSADHHIIGNNEMRLSSREQIVLDEKWKHELTHRNIEIFEKIGGDMNRKIGYGDGDQ